jgi:hypothetical protein
MSLMEKYDIIFGKRIGHFSLGLNINDSLHLFRERYPRIRLDIIQPHITDCLVEEITINVKDWGLRLRYQPLSQQLYIIEIYDFTKVEFTLHGNVNVGTLEHSSTLKSLQKILGPSFPGKFINNDGDYVIQFDGVAFMFAVPKEYVNSYKDGTVLPLDLPNNTSALLKKVFVYPIDLDVFSIDTYDDKIEYNIHINVVNTISMPPPQSTESMAKTPITSTFIHYTSTDQQINSIIKLGSTPQDIITMLGSPTYTALYHTSTSSVCHRYEYSHLGLELFFSPQKYLLYRIICHSNLPLHQDFCRYYRCKYNIQQYKSNIHNESTEGRQSFPIPPSETTIFMETTWSEAQDILQSWCSDSANQECNIRTPAIKPVPSGCPYSPTKLYGYPQVVYMYILLICLF